MALLLHYTGQDYISRGLLNTELTPGSTSAIVGGCKTGKGFAFDGTVNGGLISLTTINDNTLTMSAWIRLTAQGVSGSRYPIFVTSNAVQNQIMLDVSDVNRLRLAVLFSDNTFDACDSITNNSIQINTWYHVAASINKTTRRIQLYINGSRINTYTYTNKPLQTVDRFLVGRRIQVDNTSFNGQICNFKYYNHVLSAREIAEDYKSLMLHYKLDKPITTQVTDYSGFNRHIAVIQNTTTNSNSEKRVYGGSLANDGTQGLYGSLNLSELNGMNEISVAVRFRFISQAGTHCYFSSRLSFSGTNGISLFKVDGSSRNVYVDIAGRNTFTLPYDLVTGTWYDLVAVKSATDVKLYINGVLINTKPNTNSISAIGQLYASIGGSIADNANTISNQMNGNVQDIRFYAKALTQEDVTELYQTRHMVDKDYNQYAYELVEDTDSSMSGMKGDGSLIWKEFKERIVYPSKYWYTPSYSEIYYILNTRPNASNLKGLGRIQMADGTYAKGAFLLPDDFTVPDDLAWTATIADYTTNTYTLEQFRALENVGAVFMPISGARVGVSYRPGTKSSFILSTEYPGSTIEMYFLQAYIVAFNIASYFKNIGYSVRLIHTSPNGKFSTPSGRIDFASGNLQYHCTQHTWRFAQHQYSCIGAANANISDSYNGWIDLFGYGTSGVNYSPTLHTTSDADYASGDITNTDNDWGINEIIENDILGMSEGIITAKEFKEI